jgi:hypothetical protein
MEVSPWKLRPGDLILLTSSRFTVRYKDLCLLIIRVSPELIAMFDASRDVTLLDPNDGTRLLITLHPGDYRCLNRVEQCRGPNQVT